MNWRTFEELNKNVLKQIKDNECVVLFTDKNRLISFTENDKTDKHIEEILKNKYSNEKIIYWLKINLPQFFNGEV